MTPAPRRRRLHTRRSPRRRAGVGGRISISKKLFVYLLLFALFILLVVWIMQIGLLDYFYGQSKQKELDRADIGIIEAIQNNPAELEKTVRECAADYLLCVRVFRVDGDTAHQLASADVSDDCLIHRISEQYLTFLYNEAVAGGGLYTKRISPEILYLTNPEAMAGWADEFPRKDPNDVLDRLPEVSLDRSTNMVHIRVIRGNMGESYIIMLNSELEPLNATVETLQTQFWMIALILLVSAVGLAFLISYNISAPLRKMNAAAKQLAKGNYDADFSVDGYKEVVELSGSLTHASEQLAGTDRLQKELLANISHDLRTPLTMIIGYSEVMRDLPGENTPENVQVIIDETERLARLVNDLLDLSKIRAGSRAPKYEIFNLTELVEATMLRYEKLTEKDGYRVEFSSDTSVEIRADRTMLLQVIYNLINNAINYTGEDRLVRVTQSLSEDGTRVRVSVIDHGVGIAPDQIPLIWDRYYKIDKVHRRAMIGTGLGLSIVKQILETHRATYGVESKLGEGSTFWFEMRVEAVIAEEAEDLGGGAEDTPCLSAQDTQA